MNKTCNHLTPEQAAYIAGFVDGEGCFGVRITSEGWVSPCFEVVNTNRSVLVWMQLITGVGQIHPRKKIGKKPQTFVWVVSIQPAASLATQLMPYLHVKRLQAHLYCALAAFRRISVKERESFQDAAFTLARLITDAKIGGRKSRKAAL